jgi:hypothetical protein
MAKVTAFKKPTLDADTARAFAEGTGPSAKLSAGKSNSEKQSGQVPAGDVRVTANIRKDLHLKLKIRAAEERTTISELIERWIEGWR